MCPYRTNNYNLCKYYNNDLQSKDCTWLSKDGKLKCINKHRNINIGNLPIITNKQNWEHLTNKTI